MTEIKRGAFGACHVPFTFAEGSKLTTIGDNAFDRLNLSNFNLTLPSGVKTVGIKLFENSTVKSVTIPGTVENLTPQTLSGYTGEIKFTDGPAKFQITEDGVLYGYGKLIQVRDTSVDEITVPDGITEIGNLAFKGLKSLKSVTLPQSLTTIGYGAFSGCTALESIVIPSGVTKLSEPVGSNNGLFYNCKNLKSVTIEGNITEIPEGTFEQCSELSEFTLPSSVTVIGDNAFEKCSSLTKLDLSNVESIGEEAFRESGIEDVTNLDSLKTLEQMAFTKCTALETIALPEGIESIGMSMFNGCTGLEQIVLPSTVPEGMDLTVTSSDETVATAAFADGKLTVTGVAAGTATITAQFMVGDYVVLEDSCTVTVVVTEEGTEVIPAVEEPVTEVNESIEDDADKATASNVAGSVKADNAIKAAADQEAAALNNNQGQQNALIQQAVSELNKGTESGTVDSDDITLYTQTYLDIEATELTKDESSTVTSITLNITPKIRTVASTENNTDAFVFQGETAQGEKVNAVVVVPEKDLTINTPAQITVDLPASFANETVYVAHAKNDRTYYYHATAGSDGSLTFTSQHGFSPFTFSLKNGAAAEVGSIGCSSLQDAINEAGANDTITLLQSGLSATTTKDLKLRNGTGSQITVTINGQKVTIEGSGEYTYDYVYIPPANPNYQIALGDMENGTVTGPTSAKAGTTVTLTPVPDEGYAVGSVTVTDRFGDAVAVTEQADGTYTFVMPDGQVTVNATFVQTGEPAPAEPFPDVDENDWFYDEVVYVYENGLMNGVENNQFAPNTATNRAMLATILYRLAGQPDVSGDLPFTDVAAG